jgi:hypothetical protein
VDRPGVLAVKHRLLARSGAELPRDSRGGGVPRFPLLAASYAAVAGDLTDGTWASELRAAGRVLVSTLPFFSVLQNCPGFGIDITAGAMLCNQIWVLHDAAHMRVPWHSGPVPMSQARTGQ